MARVSFKGNNQPKDKVKIKQGDLVYCKANSGAWSFWGIYGHDCGIVCLDGAGSSYIPKGDIYLGDIYNTWLIDKRIPCDRIKITIEEEFD